MDQDLVSQLVQNAESLYILKKYDGKFDQEICISLVNPFNHNMKIQFPVLNKECPQTCIFQLKQIKQRIGNIDKNYICPICNNQRKQKNLYYDVRLAYQLRKYKHFTDKYIYLKLTKQKQVNLVRFSNICQKNIFNKFKPQNFQQYDINKINIVYMKKQVQNIFNQNLITLKNKINFKNFFISQQNQIISKKISINLFNIQTNQCLNLKPSISDKLNDIIAVTNQQGIIYILDKPQLKLYQSELFNVIKGQNLCFKQRLIKNPIPYFNFMTIHFSKIFSIFVIYMGPSSKNSYETFFLDCTQQSLQWKKVKKIDQQIICSSIALLQCGLVLVGGFNKQQSQYNQIYLLTSKNRHPKTYLQTEQWKKIQIQNNHILIKKNSFPIIFPYKIDKHQQAIIVFGGTQDYIKNQINKRVLYEKAIYVNLLKLSVKQLKQKTKFTQNNKYINKLLGFRSFLLDSTQKQNQLYFSLNFSQQSQNSQKHSDILIFKCNSQTIQFKKKNLL